MATAQETSQQARVTLSEEVPAIYKAMLRLDSAVAETPLERPPATASRPDSTLSEKVNRECAER